jgi:hypothetical protein
MILQFYRNTLQTIEDYHMQFSILIVPQNKHLRCKHGIQISNI